MQRETRLERDISWLIGLDMLIHEPSRLAILTVLRPGPETYTVLQRLTALSKGNLSNHIAKLERAGIVHVGKHFEGKTPVTTLELTDEGRTRIEEYYGRMRAIALESDEGLSIGEGESDEYHTAQ